MTVLPVNEGAFDRWIGDECQTVALALKQDLAPVELGKQVAYPPTYASIGYNIDTLSDGTKVALIDSVGSQANRMEPLFKRPPYSELVPQVDIVLGSPEEGGRRRSLLDLAHRSADAVVNSTPGLSGRVKQAFDALKQNNDAGPLCALAPTSLVFGVWDSRGGSNEKRPRLVRAIVRAWNVDVLHSAAQYNSVWKDLDEGSRDKLKKAAKKARKPQGLSEKGLKDAPATHRRDKKRVLGGVLVHGRIQRDVIVNLAALRTLNGSTHEETVAIRRYILALALLAAAADIDMFLREGCHLRFLDDGDRWREIPRRGQASDIDLASREAHDSLLAYAKKAAVPFTAKWPSEKEYRFDVREAEKLLSLPDNRTDED